MEMNIALVLIIAVVMMVLYGFLEALRTQTTTGVWDYGYLAATFIYSLLVGLIGGYGGFLTLTMPFDQWLPVLLGIWGQYFLYLTALHVAADYIISKFFPVAPQGLATPFLKQKTVMTLARK